MDAVASHIAAFHDAAKVAPGDRPWGTAAAVVAPVDANFATLQPALAKTSLAPTLERLAAWSATQASMLGERFEQRRIERFGKIIFRSHLDAPYHVVDLFQR